MGRVAGKVAFVTGAGRGQGRSHALRLAEEGADVIVTDILEPVPGLHYPTSTKEDLDETVRLVEATDRRALAVKADVRDRASLEQAAVLGIDEFGKIDVVVANAGICYVSSWDDVTPDMWNDTIAVNLTGVWNTAMATAKHLIAAGGGSMIFTSSCSGVKGLPFLVPYNASKHGVIGLVKSFAWELSDHHIRVNGVIPTGVNTPMMSTALEGQRASGELFEELLQKHPRTRTAFDNMYPVETVEPVDISNAVLYLASDEARYVTASMVSVDAGFCEA